MNISQNPQLLEQLAASHALGTLRGPARRRFEAIARNNPAVRAAALLWQERLASLGELQPSVAPSPNVWKRIEAVLAERRAAERRAQAARASADASLLDQLRAGLRLWRGIGIAGVLTSAAALGVGAWLNQQLQAAPDVQYVAVLADEQAGASVLVTFDGKQQRLTLKRVGNYREAADKSLQLWALPPSGGPQSLGVLDGSVVWRQDTPAPQVRDVPLLAISLEPKGGVPPGSGPSGPVLFKGALLKTAL